MNETIKPIILGVTAYVVSAVCMWLVIAFLDRTVHMAAWIFLGGVTLVPLFLSGYVGAKIAVSPHRSYRVVIGVVAALIGYATSLVIGRAHGDEAALALLLVGAAIVAAAGGFLGATRKNVTH